MAGPRLSRQGWLIGCKSPGARRPWGDAPWQKVAFARRARIIVAGRHRVKSIVSFKDLLESWRESAAQPRTATEYAVRLPIDDAARLAALAELFPGRTAEQLITELLATALQEIETSMPYIAGKKVISNDEQGDPIYEDVGLTPRFVELTRKNRKKLETELSKNK